VSAPRPHRQPPRGRAPLVGLASLGPPLPGSDTPMAGAAHRTARGHPPSPVTSWGYTPSQAATAGAALLARPCPLRILRSSEMSRCPTTISSFTERIRSTAQLQRWRFFLPPFVWTGLIPSHFAFFVQVSKSISKSLLNFI
jgi:hypothetical protein